MLDSFFFLVPVEKTLRVVHNLEFNYVAFSPLILNRLVKVSIVNSPSRTSHSLPRPKKRKSTSLICPKIMQPSILWSSLFVFFKHCKYCDGLQEVDKIKVSQFFNKKTFKVNGWFVCDFAEKWDTLYLVILPTLTIFWRSL